MNPAVKKNEWNSIDSGDNKSKLPNKRFRNNVGIKNTSMQPRGYRSPLY
jgi:hypothetical protein